jgi:phosphate transport system substrate-binding protein
MKSRRVLLTAILACLALLPGITAANATVYTTIEGTGSTWSQNIVAQWIADVNANGMKVVYTGGGSSKGRKDFAQGTVDFAISEIPYQGTDEQGQADTSNGRDYAYLPIVAGGTAFTYQLKVGNTMVRNLRLSGETLAKIFTNKITNWNDPAITADNNGKALPSLPITPVVRADGSGTTAQFTTWLDKQYPSIWRPYFGRSGLTSYYPKQGRMIGAAGSDQVMNQIASFSGNGTIGYIEYSYPINKTAADGKPYPVVKVLNKGGYYVEPTDYNVAVALTKAKINQDKSSDLYLTQILDGVYNATDPRAYPLSSYSYMIIPTAADDSRMTTTKRQTLADFLFYSLCTGQSKAGPYGYSPLPLNLVQAGFDQIAKLKQADPDVDLANRDVTKCNNPTFVAGNLSKNHLAETAPMPADCDKQGAGPCGGDTGTGEPSTSENQGDGNGTGTGTTGTGTGTGTGKGTGTTPSGTLPDGTPVAIDPETGLPQGSTGDTTSGQPVNASATELVAARSADSTTFGLLAAAELVALVTLPGMYVAYLRRRRPSKGGL